MDQPSVIYLDDLITQLQLIRAQYGDLQVWLAQGTPSSLRLSVQDVAPMDAREPLAKVVWIE